MKTKTAFLIFVMAFIKFHTQTPDYTKAPNSYIFNKNLAKTNNYGGIYIPVKKAYEIWSRYVYLQSNGTNTPIPAGTQSASLYWEDVPGLITNVGVVSGAAPSESKIKVDVNGSLGNGNAVIAFKVDGKIYWSWHVWVTDDPSNGVNYTQGFETDIDNNLISVQYMDRNLGASSNSFLGNDWQKSGGLLYEWGRKDPFPPLVYKDNSYYEIDGEVGYLKHSQIDNVNTIPVIQRPYNEIEKNIQYSVSNPLTYIINADANNWFSSSLYKIPGSGTAYTTWDLWSDNYKGGNSNANSSNTTISKDSKSYELKSELDPCPNGWRVPSYYGRVTVNNNLSPWGRKYSGANDDTNLPLSQLYPNSQNGALNGIKVYPGLGMDFTNAGAGARNLGIMPVSGAYVYYPNSVSPSAPVSIIFQDNNANGGLWSSTFGYDGARLFGIISDPARTSTAVGLHAVYINQTNPSRTGNAVRCMKDPNILKIGNFQTEYFTEASANITSGLDLPNTYMITDPNQNLVKIPISKPFAVYNQYLKHGESLPMNDLQVKIYWTNNKNMIKGARINMSSRAVIGRWIDVDIDPTQKGVAVISLHNGSTQNPAYWSWTIWIPEGNPAENTTTYITEQPIATQYNFVNPTKSLSPPMVTTFMDRNLGAVNPFDENQTDSAYIQSTKGMLYQWGRKDPIPSFSEIYDEDDAAFEKIIYIGSDYDENSDTISFKQIADKDYVLYYTSELQSYNPTSGSKNAKILSNILFSVQKPLNFLYRQGTGQLYDGGNKSNNNLNEIRDWVSEDRSQAAERWGHATKKSPFDPCPEGWRVPDVTFTSLFAGSKGNSPFYNSYKNDWTGKPGIIQDQWASVAQSYNGISTANGWAFRDAAYPIGSFSADGMRGELGENTLSNIRSGVWTASLADLHTGYALAMEFQGSNMVSGAGANPQAAMSVRCAKDETRYLGAPISAKNGALSKMSISKQEVLKNNEQAKNEVYPNPFTSEINFTNRNSKSFEMYDLSGKLVFADKIDNGKIDAPFLQKGVYFIKITLQDNTTVFKKIIKK